MNVDVNELRARKGYVVNDTDDRGVVTVVRRCMFCTELAYTDVSVHGLLMWEEGAFVQNAFPELSASERETVKTGTHPECWDAMFAGEN